MKLMTRILPFEDERRAVAYLLKRHRHKPDGSVTVKWCDTTKEQANEAQKAS